MNLFKLARQSLQALIDELAVNEIYVGTGLEVRPGNGLLCHYSLEDRLIYLSAPDPATPRGKFELLVLRALLRFGSDGEVMRLFELLIPWLIAHETGHYLRHKDGLFSTDLWEEERVANQLAIAFTKRRLTPAQKQELHQTMGSAIASLATVCEAEGEPAHMRGPNNFVRYVYTHMCWFYMDLMAQETQTIAEFAQAHLQQVRLRQRHSKHSQGKHSHRLRR